jgi:hypothetical protein
MNVFLWAILQLLSYDPLTWMALIGIAFTAARLGGVLGMFAGHVVIAGIITVLDVRWVTAAMRQPDWNGLPDMDMIFLFGVVGRILLVNAVLLAVTVPALRLRRQARAPRHGVPVR